MTDPDHDVTREKKSISGISSAGNQIASIRFDELACGENEVVIEHENQKYRLRVTRNGKLILNK